MMFKNLHPLCRRISTKVTADLTTTFSSCLQVSISNRTFKGQNAIVCIQQKSKLHTLQCRPKPCQLWNFHSNTTSSVFVFDTKIVAFLSGRFMKLKEVPSIPEYNRFNIDSQYEEVKKQEFGPLPISECDFPRDEEALTTWEYANREHLEFDGIKYSELPIAFIQAKYNNTFVNVSSHENKFYSFMSCGRVGFKNAKKKTIHAAETVGKQAAEAALLKGCPGYIRVKIKGPGYGRGAAIRGLAQGGMKIVSISDITPLHVEGLPQRPRKIRRV